MLDSNFLRLRGTLSKGVGRDMLGTLTLKGTLQIGAWDRFVELVTSWTDKVKPSSSWIDKNRPNTPWTDETTGSTSWEDE